MSRSASFEHKNSDPVARFYADFYDVIFNREGFVGWSYRLTHRAVERAAPMLPEMSILEIGAGTGEHLEFVRPDFASYTMLDLFDAPPNAAWGGDPRVSWVTGDACGQAIEDAQFDRVVSMCVLHHVNNPAKALENVRKWLLPGGTFSLFLPSDPGFLNRVNRKLFVNPRARRVGFYDYEIMNAREHRNHFWGLKRELGYQFADYRVRRRFYPFGLPFGDLSLFSVWHFTKPLEALG